MLMVENFWKDRSPTEELQQVPKGKEEATKEVAKKEQTMIRLIRSLADLNIKTMSALTVKERALQI